MYQLPNNVKHHKATPIFDQATIPAGLLSEHQLAAETWGKIHVLEGKLVLEFLQSGEIEVLNKDRPGIVPPELVHQVKGLEDVKFYVEFLRL